MLRADADGRPSETGNMRESIESSPEPGLSNSFRMFLKETFSTPLRGAKVIYSEKVPVIAMIISRILLGFPEERK